MTPTHHRCVGRCPKTGKGPGLRRVRGLIRLGAARRQIAS